jgi:hypothetical protein
MVYFLSLCIPLLSFILQTYPRFFNKYFGVDVWTRLLEIDQVKKAKHRIPRKITKGFIIEGNFDYPIFFPWIFSFFPKKLLFKYQGFVSPFFDVLQNVILYFIAYSLTQNVAIALLSQLIYSLIPILPIENSYLTPRSLGYLFFTLSFYPIMLFHTNHDFRYLVCGFLFSVLLFLTHRFALQSLLFISLFFTFVDNSFLYLLSFVIAGITAVLLTGGYYLRVAKGHLYNIYFWVKNYQFRFAHQIYGNIKPKKQDWVTKIYPLLSTLSPILIIATNSSILSAFVYFYMYYSRFPNFPKNIIFLKFSIWIIFFYVIGSIILRVKRLIPIGEGQRYLEMASVPSSILSAVLFYYSFQKWKTIAVIFFVFFALGNLSIIILLQIKGVIKDKNRSLTKDLLYMYRYINRLPGRIRILCIPHQITTMTVYNTKADVFVNADNPGLMKIQDVYPVLKKSISSLQKEYNLDYILFRESFAKLHDVKLQKSAIQYRVGDIVLIRLKKRTSEK